jgi:hypothetical protein
MTQVVKNFCPFIFIRGLKKADHTVFVVQNGQKTYYDNVFGRYLPYSSGQQVKRSIINSFLAELNTSDAPTQFVFDEETKNNKKSLGEGEVISICDPTYPDQLIGGWMRIVKGGEEKGLKRRSPLSISALKPLHPLLAGTSRENITFDRSDKPHLHKVVVRDSNGKPLSDEEVDTLLSGTDRSVYRKWIPDQSGSNARANGLFVYDLVIDLRTLFSVQLSNKEREINDETIVSLKAKGWKESNNVFGKCLVCPESDTLNDEGKTVAWGRKTIIESLAKSILNWRITTNQSRTLETQETLAIAISNNANKITAAIRAKLMEEEDKAKPIIEEKIDGVETFVSLACAGYVATKNEEVDALDKAELHLISLMMSFDYENQ